MAKKLTLDEVIIKIVKKHGIFPFSFDEKTIFINTREKMVLKCNFCNEYIKMSPESLYAGHKCRKCYEKTIGNNLKFTNDEAIMKIISISGIFRFNFDKFVYKDNSTKVVIGCNVCKKYFPVVPASLFKGSGCNNCFRIESGKKRSKSLDNLIKEVIHKRGIFPFSFDDAIYKNNHTEMIVRCNFCKENINISPNALLRNDNSNGCKDCIRKSTIITNKCFIERSIEKYGNRFDYSLTNYIKFDVNITLKCNDCKSIFETNPFCHLRENSKGCCQICFRAIIAKKMTKSQEQFISEAVEEHGHKYDYSKSVYIKGYKKIIITCNDCKNDFEMTPNSHLLGSNCPYCISKRFISKIETEWLDSLNIPKIYRQRHIKLDSRRIVADAYNPKTNTIYEFYGDFWHGNPLLYKPNKINNCQNKKLTFGELHKQTIEREISIKRNGYNLITIWELEWNVANKWKNRSYIKLEQKAT
jgi:hypothetical protein